MSIYTQRTQLPPALGRVGGHGTRAWRVVRLVNPVVLAAALALWGVPLMGPGVAPLLWLPSWPEAGFGASVAFAARVFAVLFAARGVLHVLRGLHGAVTAPDDTYSFEHRCAERRGETLSMKPIGGGRYDNES